ncbi:glycosyl hydrolase family protein isoform X2 [Wolffia australiana]
MSPWSGFFLASTVYPVSFLFLVLAGGPLLARLAGTSSLGVSRDPTAARYPCGPPHQSYAFCNSSLPVGLRARDIVSRLHLREKIGLLSDAAEPVPRLGLPAYEWWSESLHGLAPNGPGVNFSGGPVSAATVFPQVLLQAAAFNRTLWSSVAAAIAAEARAMYNVGQAGLTFWAPNANIFRDPRWGRGQETPGEDPMLASAFAVEYVRAFQGRAPLDAGRRGAKRALMASDGGALMLSACCKHYVAYDLEAWGNLSRYSFNAVVTEQDMGDTFLPPFRSCVREGGASCVMCSYNEVNGVPACAGADLRRLVREDWGLQGYVASDCNAVATMYEYQGYAPTPQDAVADAMAAGVDINCGGYYAGYAESAIAQGKLREEDVDRALLNLFSVQLRLGLFDGDPAAGPYAELGPRRVCSAEHRALALEAARQGIVLLKNDRGLLPLRPGDVATLAVVGPTANSSSSASIGGGYTGSPCERQSLYQGLRAFAPAARFAGGCSDVACASDGGFAEAARLAGAADAAVVVAGLDETQEAEDRDRVSLLLPGKQQQLVSAVAAASGRPIVLVLVGGGPVDVSLAKEDPRVGSILWVGYPGEAGGRALGEVLFGEFNPGGRLPVTWYPESFARSVAMGDMRMRAEPSPAEYPGRSYRFYAGEAVYPFGHGLSYADYAYGFVAAPERVSVPPWARGAGEAAAAAAAVVVDEELEAACAADLAFEVVVSVRRVGGSGRDGSAAVLLYLAPAPGERVPRKQLIGFERVRVSGGAAEVTIPVDPCEHLSSADTDGARVIRLGQHALLLEGGERRPFSIE